MCCSFRSILGLPSSTCRRHDRGACSCDQQWISNSRIRSDKSSCLGRRPRSCLRSMCVLRESARQDCTSRRCARCSRSLARGAALGPLARQLAVWSPSGGGSGRQLLRWRRAGSRGEWPSARSLAFVFPLLLVRGGRATSDLSGGALVSALIPLASVRRSPELGRSRRAGGPARSGNRVLSRWSVDV
jgi:hypothetical protein